MKPSLRRRIASCLTVIVLATVIWVNAGDVNPPAGPVGDTYPTLGFKTLQQVEPRTPVDKLAGSATALHVISAPGSYYLTSNLTGAPGMDGIDILADNVTLDLNGFALVGGPGTGKGVNVSAGGPNGHYRNITVRHGSIDGWDGDGVDIDLSWSSRVEGVHVSNCAVGILAADNTHVIDCTIEECLLTGIIVGNNCVIQGCSALLCGDNGFSSGTHGVFSHCTAESSNLHGFFVGSSTVLSHCSARSSIGGSGFVLGDRCNLSNSSATVNTIEGCSLGVSCTVSNCVLSDNGGTGINGYSDTTVSQSTISDNGFIGIWINGGTISLSTISHNSNTGIATFGDTLVVTGCNVTGNLGSGIILDNGGRVSDCVVLANAGEGIYMQDFFGAPTEFGSEISRCVSSRNIGNGIRVQTGCTVCGCTTRLNAGDGVQADSRCLIVDNTCESNGSVAYGFANAAGIRVTGGGCRVDGNHAVGNDRGIDIDAAGNTIIRNSATANIGPGSPSANYDIVAGNDVAPLSTAATAVSPYGNIEN